MSSIDGTPGDPLESERRAGSAAAGDSPRDALEALRERVERIAADVRDLAETLRAALEAAPGAPGADAGTDPLRHTEWAAACRAAGEPDRALRHTLRAAELFQAAGCTREARETLRDATQELGAHDADSLELLSRTWQRLGDAPRAARVAVEAAERHRAEGRPGRALALCARARSLDEDAPGLHRSWGLSLLGEGDPEGALGHLERWRHEAPNEPAAGVWRTQALLEAGRARDARASLPELATRFGLEAERPGAGLRERVLARLVGESQRPRGPFWEPPAIAAPDPDSRADRPGRGAALPDAGTSGGRPRVFVARDTSFHRVLLTEILAAEDIEVLRCSPLEGVLDRLRREPLAIDLMVLPLPADSGDGLAFFARLRRLPRLEDVPILAIAPLDRSGLDVQRLRALGVAGLIDKNAIPEQVVFRVNRLVRPDPSMRRRHDRAPAYVPVDVEYDGVVRTEYATSLSSGGACVLSSRAVAPGSPLRLRLPLGAAGGELLELDGRVLWRGRTRCGGELAHRVGIGFEPLSPEQERRLEAEVRRLLLLSEW